MDPRQAALAAALTVAVLGLVYLGPNGTPTDTPTPTEEHHVTTPTEQRPLTPAQTPTETVEYTHTVGCWNASINNETMYVCYDTPMATPS